MKTSNTYILFVVALFMSIAFKGITQEKVVEIKSNEYTSISTIQLQEKIRQIISPFYDHNFYARVNLFKLEDQPVDGMDKLYVTKAELAISFFNIFNNQLLFEESFTIVGSGKTQRNAERNIVSQLLSKKSKFRNKLKKNFDKHTPTDCSQLISNLEVLVSQNMLKKLLSVNTSNCENGLKVVNDAWISFQKNNCNKLLNNVRAFIASGDYSKAANQVVLIDPNGLCQAELNQVIAEIQRSYDTKEERLFNLYMEYLKQENQNRNDLYSIYIIGSKNEN